MATNIDINKTLTTLFEKLKATGKAPQATDVLLASLSNEALLHTINTLRSVAEMNPESWPADIDVQLSEVTKESEKMFLEILLQN